MEVCCYGIIVDKADVLPRHSRQELAWCCLAPNPIETSSRVTRRAASLAAGGRAGSDKTKLNHGQKDRSDVEHRSDGSIQGF